jgi:hypothetical protein
LGNVGGRYTRGWFANHADVILLERQKAQFKSLANYALLREKDWRLWKNLKMY